MNNPMILVDNLRKIYKLYNKPIDRLKEAVSLTKKKQHTEFSALNGISFKVDRGDALGVLGKNGSGKSTLLKILTGVLSPTSGLVEVNGKVSAILELGAGFNPEYTGRENIFLNGLMMGYTRTEMEMKVDKIIEFADIGSFIEQPVRLYSSGMFARLAFAVSISVNPDILIVDEALAVGDVRFQTKCIEKMKELKSSGTTIIFVSHATEQVKRFCNKAIWIKEGCIVANGEASEVADQYEDYMQNGSTLNMHSHKEETVDKLELIEEEFIRPDDQDILAQIKAVRLNKEAYSTFDKLELEIEYDVYEQEIGTLLLGAAIYTPKREYIFGPNTFLERVSIPRQLGRHVVKYVIPRIPLLGGTYCLDVGLFSNEGLVCLHYQEEIVRFTITNKYFSEGLVYMDHRWEVVK